MACLSSATIRNTVGRRLNLFVFKSAKYRRSDVDHAAAEYAVIVCDEYQGKGRGSVLTNYCIEIARKWGIKTVVAETSPSNRRMISLFSRKAFTLNREASDVVICKKEITS